MIQRANRSYTARSSRQKSGRSELAKDGEIISKSFDAIGRRPQPTNSLTLEQPMMIEMNFFLQNALTASATAGVFTGAAVTVALSSFTASIGLVTVFDQYRFRQLEVWLEFNSSNATGNYPEMFSAIDLDDTTVPVQSQIQDRQGAVIATGPAGHYHRWMPHMAVASYSGAFTSYSNVAPTWIDVASPNVQHYGLKYGLASNGSNYSISLRCRAVVEFRGASIS